MFTNWLGEIVSSVGEFFASTAFLVPFLSTLMASLTVIYLHYLNRRISETKKKLFGVSYIADVSFRILFSTLIMRKHTLTPHIEATNRMIEGDAELLDQCFHADDFNILTDSTMSFQALPEDQKVLIGLDDIDLMQTFEAVVYLYSDDAKRRELNAFVKEKLGSRRAFYSQPEEEQLDTLSTYVDLLSRADHRAMRVIWFVLYVVVPSIDKYIRKMQFLFYSKKKLKKKLGRIAQTLNEYRDLLPAEDYMQQVKMQGVQQALADKEKNT